LSDPSTAQIFKPKQQPTTYKPASEEKPKAAMSTKKSEMAGYATSTAWNNDWRITAGAGTTLFFGDIKQYKFYPVFNNKSEWRFGSSILIERQLSPVFSLRGQALYAHLVGTRREWNRNFVSKNFEFNLNTAIDLNNLIGKVRKDRPFTTSILLGTGIANYNTTLYELNTGNIVSKGGFGNGASFGGRTLDVFLMGGLSFDFRLDNNWSLRFETSNRILNTDLFDLYKNNFQYDVYNYSSVGISYTFNSAKSKVSRVPENEPMLEQVTQPAEPEQSLNQVVDVLAVDKPAAPVVEVAVIEPPVVEVAKTSPAQNQYTITGVEYRIQIRARYEGKVSKVELSKKYNIPENEISESTHNRYYIYTVGSFATYEEAAQKRNAIKSENKVYDAFIVAFKDGSRLDKLPK